MKNTMTFERIYEKEDSLPESFTSRLDDDVIKAFRLGKEFIFKDLEHEFKDVYHFLMNEMSDLYVVSHDEDDPLYHWAMLGEHFNIYSNVSRTFRKVKQKKSEIDYYQSLPDYLKPFYYVFDGFDFSDQDQLRLHECGFLLGFSNWYDMENIVEYSALGAAGGDKFTNEFCRSDVRVILRQENGKVIFIDKSKVLNGIWAGTWGELGKYQKIENPIKFINDCFFEAVNSFNE